MEKESIVLRKINRGCVGRFRMRKNKEIMRQPQSLKQLILKNKSK